MIETRSKAKQTVGERDVGRGRMVGQGCFVCRWRCQKKKKKMMGFDDGVSWWEVLQCRWDCADSGGGCCG